MGINAAERDAVRGSWYCARGDWESHGAALFQDLFDQNASAFGRFSGGLMKGLSKGSVGGSSALAAQSQSFKGAIDMFVDNMHNDNILGIQVARFAKLHKARGVSAADIEQAFGLLIGRMVKYYDADEGSWKSACNYIMSLMRGHL